MTSEGRNIANRSKSRKVFFRWLKVIVLLYASSGILLYYLQDKLFLHPKPLAYSYIYHFNVPSKEINIDINNNETLNMVEFLPAGTAKGIVLYFHGNMENINHYAEFATNFTNHGYEVWMPDYPGFGKTTGELIEAKLYSQSAMVYQLARNRMSPDSIVIYGRSFGTGIAAHLASENKCRLLILETPYWSIPAIVDAYAPIYPVSIFHLKLPTGEYVKKVTVPVVIFHGTDDGVIRYRSASRLKDVLKPTDKFITIEKGSHNDLNNFPLFHKTLDSLLEKF